MMHTVTIKNLDSLTREYVIELMHETRLIIIENETTIPEKELVQFYHHLGDPVRFDEEYMSEEYCNEWSKGYRELIPVRNQDISGYGPPGLFSGVSYEKGKNGYVPWHLESQNRDTHDDIICLSMRRMAATGGETHFMDQKVMYDNLIKTFPELDEYEVDWSNRFAGEKPDNDHPYNPWTKWDEKCIKGGDGWNFMRMKDIDGKYLVEKEVKERPLVTKNTITGQRGLMFPCDTVYNLKPKSEFLFQVLEKECEKEEYRYHHKWKSGDILISDIQHSLHKRDYYTGDRLIYRSSIYMPENPNDPRKQLLH